jgi:hypothetical protein
MVADDREDPLAGAECSEGGGLVGTTTVTIGADGCITGIQFVAADAALTLTNTRVL